MDLCVQGKGRETAYQIDVSEDHLYFYVQERKHAFIPQWWQVLEHLLSHLGSESHRFWIEAVASPVMAELSYVSL